jgi:hypothetical protein
VALEFPCGYRASLKQGDPSIVEDGHAEKVVRFSTKKCQSCAKKCTNPGGHKGHYRLGTPRAPHVDVECAGVVKSSTSPEIEAHLVLTFARSQFKGVARVYWVEPSVYEAVDASDAHIGFVLMRGAPEPYLKKKKWKFFHRP